MSGQHFLDIDTTTGQMVRRTALQTSAGAGDANKIPRTGADGKLDASFMPSTGSESAETIQASESLAAGDWINIHAVSGARRVRKALATDATRPVHGFVTEVVTSGANATVYTRGINASVVTTGFVAADVGSPVFLSAATSGGCTKTAPSTSGNLVQRIGYVIEVGATVRVQMDMSYIVTL